MMRGSVVFLAVFAVASWSAGVNGANFVESGITGTGRGNEDAPGIEESAFGNGDNGGHRIGKRSSLGQEMARQAARRQQMMDPNAPSLKPTRPPQFSKPVLLPNYPISILPPAVVEPPPPSPRDPIPEKLWTPPPMAESRDLPLKRAVPSAFERELRSLTALKFLPLSEVKDVAMKIISNALPNSHVLPAILPQLSARRSYVRSQDFSRSGLKNRRSRYSDSRSFSPWRSYQTLPGPLIDELPSMPLYKHARNAGLAQPDIEENLRAEVRSVVIKYLVQVWNEISKLFKPGSNSGGGTGVVPPEEELPVEGGKELGPGLPVEQEVHTERPPEEYPDDVIIEPVTPPIYGDQVIHLSSDEDAPEAAEDTTGEGSSDADDDYPVITHFKPYEQTNWEIRQSTGTGDGPEEAASKIRGTSAGTRKKDMRFLDAIPLLFGRQADD